MTTTVELETPEIPEELTITSLKGETYEQRLRASLSLKPSKYVFRCGEKDEDFWDSIYPPAVKEVSSLPGSGLPEWHYEWNYCIDCNNSLRNCKSNPYGFFGSIGIARTIAAAEHRAKREAEAKLIQVLNAETGEITTVSKSPRKSGLRQSVDTEDMASIKDAYTNGTAVGDLVTQFNTAPKALYEFLKSENILRGRGERTPNSTVRLGKPKSTLAITSEMVEQGKDIVGNKKMGLVEFAKSINVKPNELSAALKAAGVVIKKGRAAGTKIEKVITEKVIKVKSEYKPKGNVRTTNLVTSEIVEKALELRKTMGVVAVAKELNCNPNELSLALKKAGDVITKGRKK